MNLKKEKIINITISIIPFIFYLFFAFYDGYFWCDDTYSFVHMSITREPLYPLFLLFLRSIFVQENIYLFVAVLMQSTLIAYATYSFCKYIKNEFDLNSLQYALTILILLFVSILCRFFAKRASMYSNSILSESLSYPLYLLFFKYLFDYISSYNRKSLILASIFSFLLIALRRQMYISLICIVLCLFYVIIVKKKCKRNFLYIFLVVAIVLGGNKLFDFTYTTIVNGLSTTSTGSNRFLTTIVLYNSDKSCIDSIEDKELKVLFSNIYTECKRQNLLKETNLQNDWYSRTQHFAYSYDDITIEAYKVEDEYLSKEYSLTGSELEIVRDSYNNKLISALLFKTLPSIIPTYLDNLLLGFMITVSADKEILLLPSIFIYLTYIVMAIFCYINNKKKAVVIAILTSILVILNTCVVSLIIFSQTRYMIYNLGLFYISYLILLINTYSLLRNK